MGFIDHFKDDYHCTINNEPMTPKEKARELVEDIYYTSQLSVKDFHNYDYAKQCALICVDNEYNGIIYVLGDLKARGELSERIYLKAVTDLNKERQEVKKAIQEL